MNTVTRPSDALRRLLLCAALTVLCTSAADRKLKAVIVDGVNNHDWAPATAAIQSILEGTGRFNVAVSTYPKLPDFAQYDVVIDNFNGGHLATGTRWPAEAERALETYVRGGGGLVIYHAANNAFLLWPEFNRMIGLGWREPSFGQGIAIGANGQLLTIPQGQGLPPGHGPRHDFELFVLDQHHPITNGLPPHWLHPSEQLTHGQHGPAEGLTILTYAFSEVSRQGEPMDWVRDYSKGRIYTTMLGHTWKNELSPNLDDLYFQALLARGTEWAATGTVTLPPDLGWKPLFNGKNFDGWEVRGPGAWSVLDNGVLLGQRSHPQPAEPFGVPWPVDQEHYRDWLNRQASLYTKQDFGDYDLHLEYWIPPGANAGVSTRDGHLIEIAGDDREKPVAQRAAAWNSMEIEWRNASSRARINGQLVSEYKASPAQPRSGPIGLQLRDQFTLARFRNIRIRQR
jgi:uncharacterized protein